MRNGGKISSGSYTTSQYYFQEYQDKEKAIHAHLRLVRTLDFQSKVFSLDRGKLGELSVDVVKVEGSNLLVEDLGDEVNTNWLLASGTEFDVFLAESSVLGLVEEDLSKHLVGERA